MAERTPGTPPSGGSDAQVAGDAFVRDVRHLVEHYVHADVITVTEPSTGVEALAIRSGNTVVPLPTGIFEPFRDLPRRRAGSATLLTIESLIDHVNRFRDDGTVVFADNDRVAPSITAVLDYHFAGIPSEAAPRFGKHRSHYAFPLADEWKAWLARDGEAMSMADFAAFLEERIIDVLYLETGDGLPEDVQRMLDAIGGNGVASPAKLMELARGLQVNESAVVQEAVNLQTGEAVVRFEAAHTGSDGGPVRVPSIFLIGIPVFNSGAIYRIAARLRYRKAGAKLVFWYDLWRTDRTFDHAFNEAVERVHVETSVAVLIGKPEA